MSYVGWVVIFSRPGEVGRVDDGADHLEVCVPYDYAIDKPGAISVARGMEKLTIPQWVPLYVYIASIEDSEEARQHMDRARELARESAKRAA